MARPLSPIHRPLDPVIADLVDIEPKDPFPAPPTRIARLAALDQRTLGGTPRSLGPGGASAVYEQAVRKALVDEMVFQLRHGDAGRPGTEIGEWAFEITAAFREK
jgi:hypothetical protein